MVTLLRPRDGVRCPKLSDEDFAKGLIRAVAYCMNCDQKEEVRRPWHGYMVRCKLDGKSDNRTPEYE